MTDIYTLFPSFNKTMPDFIKRDNVFAIYGIDPDPSSLSYAVYEALKKEGLKVYALNSENEIDGDKIYPDLKSLPEEPDVVCLVTKPENTLEALKNALKQGASMIWIDMGSETSEAINYCKDNNINAIYYHSLVKELFNPTAEKLKELGKEIS